MSKPYSEWLRMDLHIHTDCSKRTKHGDYKGLFSVDELYAKLTQSNVQVFSLTDHNIINIEAYKEYYAKHTSSNDPLLLVGVELDIVIDGATAKTYHTLIIFNYSTFAEAQYVHAKLEAQYLKKGMDDYARTLTMDEVIELFPDDDFFFIPHAGSNKSIITVYKENISAAQRMIILMQSAMEKVHAQRRQNYNNGFNNILKEAFKGRGNHAYIEFSDNHCIGSYPRSENGSQGVEHDFYYVKGSKCFETLRQAFIDPESRIKSSCEYKLLRNTPRYIESIELEPHGIIKGQTIYFSPHLNVLIGGRSTGKSLLLSLLSQKIDSIQHRAKREYPIDSAKIRIKAIQDSIPTYQTSIVSNKLTYIGQGEIVNYFERGNLSELAKSTGTSEIYSESKQAFSGHRRELDLTIDRLIDIYGQCEHPQNEKYILHQSTIDRLLSDSFAFTWEEDQVLSSNDYSKPIGEAEETITKLLEYIGSFKSHSIINFDSSETALIESFERLVNHKYLELLKTKKNKSKTLMFLQNVSQIISSKNKALDEGAQQKISARSELRELQSKIKQRFINLVSLNQAASHTASFDYSMKRDIELHEGIKLVLEVKKEPDCVIEKLITDGIKNARPGKSLYLILLDLLFGDATVKNFGDGSSGSLRKKISAQLQPIYDQLAKPSDYLDYGDGDNSANKSPGYNSEKYLEIVLKSSETELVFIDQPEDNLGNAFIAERLVELIRDMKFSKQVFIVTHNPSVVVHGDAENVIIAQNFNNIIHYTQGVIEDKKIQRDICKILDGGEYIFNTRSRKYNIERILREHESKK